MTERNREREAAFEFARRLGDPAFRAVLADHGCTRDQDVVVTLDEVSMSDVLERVFIRCRPPALVAIRRESAAQGFVFLVVGAQTDGASTDTEADKMSEEVSVGMVYDSMSVAHGRTFEIGEHFAYNIQPLDPSLQLAEAS
ncbi:hypothetical protein ACN27G_31235 [Plantactinospora sp. WMMB334]|uniref:hypothetical protein n=1 Tax=Plantactinospora sp. WMMB334 TaxID=3404119 RepID=UPI003B959ADA